MTRIQDSIKNIEKMGIRRIWMMADYSYNQVTPELIEAFKKIVPGKVFTGDEINADYSHDEMPIYGKGAPTVLIEEIGRAHV